MRFHPRYCPECKKETLFLESLTRIKDAYCSDIQDKCQECKLVFEIEF